jgi:hypothetical protein
LLLCPAASARADDPPPKPDRPWSIDLVLGASFGGPLDDIATAMEAAGFDDDVDYGDWGGIGYPLKSSDSSAWWGAARRRVGHDRWSVGIAAGWSDFGAVYGNRSVGGLTDPDHRLVAAIETMTFAPMAWYQALPGARLGFGLGVNRTETWFGSQYSGEEFDDWKPGVVMEGAVTTPASSRFYFLLLLQYRWIQDGTLGPLQETASTGEVIVFPESDITLSHGFIGAGLGIRF